MLLSFWTLLALLGLTLATPVPAPITSPIPIPNPSTATLSSRETDLNAFLSLLLDRLPAISGTLTSVSSLLTTFQSFLALISGKKTTYNQLVTLTTSKNPTCKAYTVIFARGTVEPGNVGILVGPPFFDALKARIGGDSLLVQGVNEYVASVKG
ncbi:hypothetical protein VTL71DRAFT_15156 [Oculimacula yallundae]|uniref:cutinase n=1 Tax=Oculimacula yallundae TaxID=86028 RepID=A0ABR4CFV3_9HELO